MADFLNIFYLRSNGAILLKISTSQELIKGLTLVVLLIGVIVIGTTIGFVIIRRISKRIEEKFEKLFRKWIAEEFALLAKKPAHIINIPTNLQKALKSSIKSEIAVKELLVCKKYLKGAAMQMAVNLYEQLDLRKTTNTKLKSRIWSRVVNGIQEIYIFDQYDAMEQLFRFADNANGFIRAEAQIGIINLQGFDGLHFLINIRNQLSHWDHICLLEQLKLFAPKPLEEMPAWLSSTNNSVVELGLMLLYEYPEKRFYPNLILCFKHKDPTIRHLAIRCCEKINVFDTAETLEQQYVIETNENKLLILDTLMLLPEIPSAKLLVSLLNDSNELIGLKAAENIVKHYEKGLLIVESSNIYDKETKDKIIKHLQTEICL